MHMIMIPMLTHICSAPASTLDIVIMLMCACVTLAACVYFSICFFKEHEYFIGICCAFISLMILLLGISIVI